MIIMGASMKGVLVTLVHYTAKRVLIVAKNPNYLRHVRLPVCPSDRPYACISACPTGRIYATFDIRYSYENL